MEHRGVTPHAAATAYVAPTAEVCDDVEIGEECPIMIGAVLVAEKRTRACRRPDLIMENAVVRA